MSIAEGHIRYRNFFPDVRLSAFFNFWDRDRLVGQRRAPNLAQNTTAQQHALADPQAIANPGERAALPRFRALSVTHVQRRHLGSSKISDG